MSEEIRYSLDKYDVAINNGEAIFTPKKEYVTEEIIYSLDEYDVAINNRKAIVTPKKEYVTEEKIRYSLDKYDVAINNKEAIVTSKKEYVTEKNLASYDFTGSSISPYSESSEYGVKSRNETISRETCINPILTDICKFLKLPNPSGSNYNVAVKKIVKLAKENSLSINLPIKLKDGKVVYLLI
jgi:uncharacterized protein YxjI